MLQYPNIKPDNIVETIFDIQISDPYRFLENSDNQKTTDWINQQNKLTSNYFENIENREKITQDLEKNWSFENYSTPYFSGGKYYFWHNDGFQNQAILYCSSEFKPTEKIEILNPNLVSKTESENISVNQISFSKNGKYLAYAKSTNGSDWLTVSILDLENNSKLDDEVKWLKRSNISWYKDGFFYSRFPEPKAEELLTGKDIFHQLFYHKLGQNQAEDILIYQDKNAIEIDIRGQVCSNENFLIIKRGKTEQSWATDIVDLRNNPNLQNLKIKTLTTSYDHDFDLINPINHNLYFLTDFKADNNCVIKVDFNNLAESNWEIIIPNSKDKLEEVKFFDDFFICKFIENASNILTVFSIKGERKLQIKLPGIGSITEIKFNSKTKDLYYKFSSFIIPPSIYKFNLNSQKLDLVFTPNFDFDFQDFELQQIWYNSKDGAKIPMFIAYKKGLELKGNNPTWLYGYGGFNVSVLPSFSIQKMLFMQNGGVFCVANIRGGGEFGKNWYETGIKFKKQNSFDDFIAASEYLIDKKYTDTNKLVIEGGSNGGLLVATCILQRPELFAVCICHVPVTDMIRFQNFTEGRTWSSDYGLATDSPEMLDYLLSYSPLHNCKNASYPATLILTADHDDRVVPLHSYKFTASLQTAQQSDNPILIRIDTKSGHGAGKPIKSIIEEKSDILNFIYINIFDSKF